MSLRFAILSQMFSLPEFPSLFLRKLRNARLLTARDWILLPRIWLALLLVELLLRHLSFQQVEWLLRRVGGRGRGTNDEVAVPAATRRLRRLVGIAARNHLVAMTCLRQAMVLQWLLRRGGIDCELRFGVRLEHGELRAHAWLEHEGCPLGEPASIAAQYAPLARATGAAMAKE